MRSANSTLSNIGKNIFSLAASELVCRILGAIVLLILPRYLGPADYGTYSLAISFFMLFSIFTGYGLDGIFIKDVARDKNLSQRYFSTNLAIKLSLSIIAVITLAIVVFFLNYPLKTTLAILILGSSIFIQSIAQSYSAVFRAYEKMEYNAIFAIARSLMSLLGILLLIQFKGAVISLVLILVIINFILALAGFALVNRLFFKIIWKTDFSFMIDTFKKSTPFFLVSAIAGIHSRVDLIMISKLSTEIEVGFYGAANELVSMLYLVPNLVATVLFPVFSKQHHESSASLVLASNLSIKYIGIIGFPISAGVYFVAPQVTDLIYGSSFMGSVKTLQVLGLTVCILFISNIIAYILTAVEKVKHVTHANASSVIVNIALNLWFIPLWGGMGAALATLVCSIVKSVYIYRVFALNFNEAVVLKNLVKPLLATCFMSVVLLSFPSGLAVTILLGVISYGFFLVLLRTFSRDEIHMFRQMIPYPQVSR